MHVDSMMNNKTPHAALGMNECTHTCASHGLTSFTKPVCWRLKTSVVNIAIQTVLRGTRSSLCH